MQPQNNLQSNNISDLEFRESTKLKKKFFNSIKKCAPL